MRSTEHLGVFGNADAVRIPKDNSSVDVEDINGQVAQKRSRDQQKTHSQSR